MTSFDVFVSADGLVEFVSVFVLNTRSVVLKLVCDFSGPGGIQQQWLGLMSLNMWCSQPVSPHLPPSDCCTEKLGEVSALCTLSLYRGQLHSFLSGVILFLFIG